jgi:hypothetical protein
MQNVGLFIAGHYPIEIAYPQRKTDEHFTTKCTIIFRIVQFIYDKSHITTNKRHIDKHNILLCGDLNIDTINKTMSGLNEFIDKI